jgi:hypothetical protein
LKTASVHTVTYFIIGILSFVFLGYTSNYANPDVTDFMRQTDHPLVMAGPFFQILRGLLFGVVFYALRGSIFPHKRGWLTLWLVLVVVGILSPFGAAPSSIEGMIYSVLPAWFHILNFPEILVQSGLLAFLIHHWVNHSEKRWLNLLLGIVTALIVLISLLGALSAFDLLPPSS